MKCVNVSIPPWPFRVKRKVFMITLLAVAISLLITRQVQAVGFPVQLESDGDRAGGSEVAYVTYNSFSNLLIGNFDTAAFTPFNVAETFSTTGLAFDGNTKGNGGVIPEPSTLLLFSTGLLGLMGYARRRKHQEATNKA